MTQMLLALNYIHSHGREIASLFVCIDVSTLKHGLSGLACNAVQRFSFLTNHVM